MPLPSMWSSDLVLWVSARQQIHYSFYMLFWQGASCLLAPSICGLGVHHFVARLSKIFGCEPHRNEVITPWAAQLILKNREGLPKGHGGHHRHSLLPLALSKASNFKSRTQVGMCPVDKRCNICIFQEGSLSSRSELNT